MSEMEERSARLRKLGLIPPHFFCRICQRVYDIELPQARPSPDEAAGHKIEAVQTYAYGICAACRRKQNEEGIDA